MTYDVAAVKAQFPIFRNPPRGKPLHYFDSAASSQVPQVVLDAVMRHETTARANVLRGVHALAEAATENYENARIDVARFLGARTDEVVFTGGCTAAINLVAASFCSTLKPGDEIVLSELEHHSNIVPWQMAAERHGLAIKALPVTQDGRIDLARTGEVITDHTRIVSVAHVSNVTGALTDVPALVAAAKRVGAAVMLDGAQRAPHGPIDLPALGVDFYVFAGHKTYGPNGIGVLWGRQALLAELPPFMGGGSMIGRVTLAKTTYAPAPRRFEAGTPPIAQAVGLAAACRWMESLDHRALGEHEMSLTQRLLDGLASVRGARLFGPVGLQGRFPVVSFTLEGVHPHDVAQILDGENVAVRAGHHCAQPLMDRFDLEGTTRASIAPYVDAEDVDALLASVEKAARLLG
jgi:cysteine desulfurase/selenocysteine lyase